MTLLILSCFVSGIPHRNPDLSLVNLNDPIRLKPDPTNQYDPLAIEVHCGDQFLGFVPREQTPVIHYALDHELQLKSWVQEKPMTKWKEVLIRTEATIP